MHRETAAAASAVVLSAYILTAAFVFAADRFDRPGRESRIPDQYIVVFNDSVEDIATAEEEIITRGRGERIASYRSAIRGFAGRFTAADIEAIADDPRIAFISEDREVSISGFREDIRGDGSVGVQVLDTGEAPMGVDRVDADGIQNTGAGAHVAVIDTGINSSHPELSGKVVGGRRCIGWWGGHNDDNGHGTHVAGTIAAKQNNAGVVGVAPDINLWSIKVLDRNGGGSWSSVICGIDYVTARAPANGGPIQVANLSLSGFGTSDNNCGNSNGDALHRAICRARDAGVTIVVAAGNNAGNAASQVPAAYDDAVITVSALADSDGKPGGLGAGTSYGADDTFASFSNWGSPVDIGAPGVGIVSAWLGSGYATLAGTSMAAPHVAGAAALYLKEYPQALWSEVRDALVSTGEVLGAGHTDPSGRHPEPILQIDSLAAATWLAQQAPQPPPPQENPAPLPDPEPDPQPDPPQPPSGPVEYHESFEQGLNWTNDNQRDWRVRRSRSTDGRQSIEVDGRANNAGITSPTIDLGGHSSATITFDWYIERRLDTGEYIAFDVSLDGGSSWTEKKRLRGNVDAEERWHSESVSVSGIGDLTLRFRGSISHSSEDANVDNIRVISN